MEGSENTEQVVVVGNRIFEVSAVLLLSSGLNFEACFCQVCYLSGSFLSVEDNKEQCETPVSIGFSPAMKLFALLGGGASKQHSLTVLDFWVNFMWRKS